MRFTEEIIDYIVCMFGSPDLGNATEFTDPFIKVYSWKYSLVG